MIVVHSLKLGEARASVGCYTLRLISRLDESTELRARLLATEAVVPGVRVVRTHRYTYAEMLTSSLDLRHFSRVRSHWHL